MSSRLDFLVQELKQLDERALRRRARPVDGPQRAHVTVDGKQALNFSSNNYLGLADHRDVRAAASDALANEGLGSGASRLIVGNLRAHRRLEETLAHFHQTEAALVFNSGYQANVGILSSLAGAEDVIFSDELNHASLIDGCRLARATTRVYRHVDLADLEGQLAQARTFRRRFLVSDTIFSMDGDVAPVAALRRLADRYDAILVLDEAHATGVLGPLGRGAAAEADVKADVHMATLSKGLGAFGAYVAGARPLVDFLANRARSFVFTTALPPSIAAAAEAAVKLAQGCAGDDLRESLGLRIAQLADGLRRLGLLASTAGRTPIFPIHVGDERRVMEATEVLLDRGVFAQGIRPPTVPVGTARLRFSVMATHTAADIDHALSSLADLVHTGLIPRTTP